MTSELNKVDWDLNQPKVQLRLWSSDGSSKVSNKYRYTAFIPEYFQPPSPCSKPGGRLSAKLPFTFRILGTSSAHCTEKIEPKWRSHATTSSAHVL
ncbi:vacuolar protein sorting protein 46 [Moniliophthora roreri]|nr:vacuolar protein sorting protein 46 [Moniliophthora roreri]